MQPPAIQLLVSLCDDDEARDLAAAVAGDHHAFGRLYDRHASVVLSLCRRMNGSPSEADDALQETFIRAHSMLDQVDRTTGASGFRRWLYAIARRVCSERRRAANRRSLHEGAAMTQAAVMLHDAQQDRAVESAIARADEMDRLTAALRQLDDDERLAIHLHYLDADPAQSAASALRLSRSAYYKLLKRARNRLATLMRMRKVATPAERRQQSNLNFESFRIRTARDQS